MLIWIMDMLVWVDLWGGGGGVASILDVLSV